MDLLGKTLDLLLGDGVPVTEDSNGFIVVDTATPTVLTTETSVVFDVTEPPERSDKSGTG